MWSDGCYDGEILARVALIELGGWIITIQLLKFRSRSMDEACGMRGNMVLSMCKLLGFRLV